jgi:chromosome segregation ATPase
MSCIVYQVNKKTGIKYAYESISYWDKEKQQPRSKRKYIGRVDPETGEIIRKKERMASAEPQADGSSELADLYEEIQNREDTINELREELNMANARYDALVEKVRKVRLMIAEDLSDV